MEDKFTTYSSTLLAGEDFFVGWVLRGENKEQWNEWVQRHQDRQHIIEEARQMVLSVASTPVMDLSETEKKELWNRISDSTQAKTQEPTKNNLRQLFIWTLSAAAAFAFLVWINNLTAHERIIARAGEQKEVFLPEQSAVTLNAGSMSAESSCLLY